MLLKSTCIPVGNAGNITAYWKGYSEYAADGIIDSQAAHVRLPGGGLRADRQRRKPVLKPMTIATAIRIGNPASWKYAEAARDDSGGLIDSVTDKQILEAYRLVARTEAVFVEPASAASVAGLLKTHADGRLPEGLTVVCTVTGNGLKDPDWAIAGAPAPITVPVDALAAAAALGLA